MPLDGLTFLEADPEFVDQNALIAQRLGGVDDTLGPASLGGGEAFLARDVRVEIDSVVQRCISAAVEAGLLHQSDSEVRSVGCLVVQLVDLEAVEILAAADQVLVVLVPCLDRVIGDATCREDGLPEFFHSLMLGELGEEFSGPGFAGDCSDAPLVFVLHLVPVLADDGEQGLL